MMRGVALLALLLALPAHAQTWPSRPIKVIVSFPAGSAPDIACRVVTDRLSRSLGTTIVVDNRPDAS